MSQYPVINAGTTPTVAVLQAMLPQHAWRSSDGTAIVSNTTLANEPVLVLALPASSTWRFTLDILYKGNTAGSGDLKIGWSVPSGCTIRARTAFADTSLVARFGYLTEALTQAFGSNGTGSPLGAVVAGQIFMSSTGGSVNLKVAQNTSNATGTTILTGSGFSAWREA
jgi:hypothetical protein